MSDRPPGPRLVPFGDAAILIVLGDRIDPRLNDRVHRLAAAMRELAGDDPRFGAPVPAYASLLVPFEPVELGTNAALDLLTPLVEDVERQPPDAETPERGTLHEIPTRYGGEDGPDLEDVAVAHGLSAGDVIELHAAVEYRVYMLGFAPGFAYLGQVSPRIATPRRDSPRPRVPAGSIGIGGDQTGIYPFESPAGWHLIGRTDAVLWDARREPPALLGPTDRVRFVPLG